MAYTALFSPGQIGTLKAKNRLVMPSMVLNYADGDGKVTKRYVDHIERVARGGVGTIVLEASYIRQDGKGFLNELGVHDDACIPGLKKLVAVAHAHGAVIGIQLYHAGRQTSSKTSGTQPVAPSPLPDPTVNELPRELALAEIPALVEAYGKAAARAKAAGMDFVELHGAHGYLITQFLSPFSNRRTDAYGGTPQKRLRFALEVYEAVRKAVGANFPVTIRLSGEEMVEGGLTLLDTIEISKRLESAGVDAIHVSAGNYASYARGYMIPPMAMPDGTLAYLASAVKGAVKIPVITVAKIRDPKLAEKILKNGEADFVAVGRTLLADPEWPNKVKGGRLDEINPCIACNQGCISRLFAQQDVWCTVNPETGREGDFAKPAKSKKTVVIVGGGPAGLSAAKTAAARGHRVVLYEKRAKLGGQLFAAEAAPHRQGWKELRHALVRDVKRLGVEINLGVEFSPALLGTDKPDAIILAMGSTATKPKIPGIGRTNVVSSRDLLEGTVKAKGGVVVVGGGCAGAQTAEYLAQKGYDVKIIEATGAIATDAPIDDRFLLLGRLNRLKVKIHADTALMSIGPNSVTVESPSGSKTMPADTVVLCLGSFPNDGITAELKTLVKEVLVVGDAVSARRVTDAVAEGALAALAL
ncbi:MAG: FAD-dependent oxidoreductase [Patescibacteria group bacterium]|jgi:2,4-dienoyl-CoA reductase-like NADH-dependent reductase (Old Yellow Enzyme family)/thioredoxin reductase